MHENCFIVDSLINIHVHLFFIQTDKILWQSTAFLLWWSCSLGSTESMRIHRLFLWNFYCLLAQYGFHHSLDPFLFRSNGLSLGLHRVAIISDYVEVLNGINIRDDDILVKVDFFVLFFGLVCSITVITKTWVHGVFLSLSINVYCFASYFNKFNKNNNLVSDDHRAGSHPQNR